MPAGECGRRAYVNASVFDAIREIPAVRAARQVFAFQPPTASIPHTAGMLLRVADRMALEGQVKRLTPTSVLQRVARALPIPRRDHLVSLGPAPDGKALYMANRIKGPLQLISNAGVPIGQGDQVYDRLHATVLLASFEHKGRHIGLLLDGNDLQENPVTWALQKWQSASGDRRALPQLSARDFAAFNRDHPDLDLYQGAFRMVDLDGLVEVGRARALRVIAREWALAERDPVLARAHADGNTVLAVPDIQPVQEPMTATQARTLAAAIDHSHGVVEPDPQR